MICAQDKMIWVQKRFAPLKNPKGKIIGVFGAIIDISEKVNRRKDLESYTECKHVFGKLLTELNAKLPLSTDYKELIAKSMITLKEESQASLAILIDANAQTPEDFFQFATEDLDVINFLENRKLLLNVTGQSGYLDPEAIKALKDFDQSIDSVFFYRIKLNDLIKYEDVIVLINPNKDKLEAVSIFLSLTHHIVHCSHVSCFLAATNRS